MNFLQFPAAVSLAMAAFCLSACHVPVANDKVAAAGCEQTTGSRFCSDPDDRGAQNDTLRTPSLQVRTVAPGK